MIGFLTDWGLKSHYVGVAKAVIKRINPSAEIIDITHEIEPFNVRKASHVLYRASLDFPPSTVFLVVVDYGVGTARKAIVMKTRNDLFFVAPDNGVLTVVAEEYGVAEIREIENRELFYKKVLPSPSTGGTSSLPLRHTLTWVFRWKRWEKGFSRTRP